MTEETEQVKNAVQDTIKEGAQTMDKVSPTFKQKIVRYGHKVLWKTKKNSPELLLAGGLVGIAVTGYLAFKAAPKVEKIKTKLSDDHDTVGQMQTLADAMEELAKQEKTDKRDEDIRELTKEFHALNDNYHPYTRSELVLDFTKAVAAPVVVGSLSVAAIIFSHNIQYRRIGALASSLATAVREQKAFEEKYREKYGDEEWNKFDGELNQKEVTTEDGAQVQVEAHIKDNDKGRWYDESEEYVSDDHQYNLSRIDSVNQKYLDKYFANGYLVMNDVLEGLGFERTREGALIGWSGADEFQIDRRVQTVYNEETGEPEDRIYVYWPQPHYVYDEVEFSGRYAQ